MRDDCTGIEGIEPAEAEALIAALADHIVKPAFIYRHQWRPGDLLLWDNCTVQHRAIQDYDLPHRRLMHRTSMGGNVPISPCRALSPPATIASVRRGPPPTPSPPRIGPRNSK